MSRILPSRRTPQTARHATGLRQYPVGLLCLTVCLPALVCAMTMLALSPDIATGRCVTSPNEQRFGVEQATPTASGTNGAFAVAVLIDDTWHEVDRLAYTRFLAERELTLADLPLTDEVAIRISHSGGTAAHIDAVSVGGRPPSSVAGAGESHALAKKKLAVRDFDLVDAQNKTLVITFAPSTPPPVLSLVARIEPEIIPETPYQFPLENMHKPMSPDSVFYTYIWDSQPGELELEGELSAEDLGAPFLSVFCEPGTGHPNGFTHGWIRNDSSKLYVALDFTPDNTMDGDKDYAKVYVHTASGLRVFKVSLLDTRWGIAGFTYTERVPYQHKVYEFAIPVAEIGEGLQSGDALQLAFGLYGTVSPPPPAYPGPLDPSFGGDGIVTADRTPDDQANDIVIQSTGKIVVGGWNGDTGDHAFSIMRFRPDGTPDPTFGASGVVTYAIGANAEGRALARVQPQDTMVLAGDSEYGGDRAFTLVRTDGEGQVDPSFGVMGVVTTDIGPGDDICYAVAPAGDKLVAAGASYNGVDYDFAVVRYLMDGSPDPTFGSNGVVTTPVGSASDLGYGVVVQPDGKTVVVGYSQVAREADFALARYDTGGNLDASFGVGGITTTAIGASYDHAYAVALWGDKIIVAGSSRAASDSDFAVARYDYSGHLDASFGSSGIVTTNFGLYSNDVAYDLVIDKFGRILVAGENLGYFFALMRYMPDGTPDPLFGHSGMVNLNIGPLNSSDGAQAVAIQPNGRILVAGTTSGPLGDDDVALARYGRDLHIHKVAIPPTVLSGHVVRYRLTFGNEAGAARQVRIDEMIPPSVIVTDVVSSGVPITEVLGGPLYRWRVGKLGYNQGGMITITGRAPATVAPMVITNTASIATPDLDSDMTNNQAAAAVTVVPLRVSLPVVLRGAVTAR